MEKKSLFPVAALKHIVLPLLFLCCCAGNERTIEQGLIHLKLGDYERAIRVFSSVIDRNPSSWEARLGLGKALIQKLAVFPADTLLWRQSITQLEAAKILNPRSEINKLLGVAWFKRAEYTLSQGDSIGALAALTRSIAYEPTVSRSVNLAGIIYYNLGQETKAQTLFTQVITIDSCSPTGYFNLGMVWWGKKNYRRAKELFYRAIQKSPDNEEILRWIESAEMKIREEE